MSRWAPGASVQSERIECWRVARHVGTAVVEIESERVLHGVVRFISGEIAGWFKPTDGVGEITHVPWLAGDRAGHDVAMGNDAVDRSMRKSIG